MKRKFFSVLVCQKGKDYCLENLNRIIDGDCFVFAEDTIQRGAYESIEKGDVLLLKYQNDFVAYAEVIRPYHVTTDDHWNQVIETTPWVLHDATNRTKGIGTYGISWQIIDGGTRGIVKELDFGWVFSKMSAINKTSSLFKTIEQEMSDHKDEIEVAKCSEILKGLKPQIILQGPPGTGKTRLAQMIASKLSAGLKIASPMKLIDDFFKDYDLTDSQTIAQEARFRELLDKFRARFPMERLSELSLEEYAQGHGDNDSFCWWMETGLSSLGKFRPGNSMRYKIYWDKKKGVYSKHGNLIEGLSDNEAIKAVANVVSEVVVNKDMDKGAKHFGDSFLLKVLNTYYPEEFFPINSEPALNSVLSMFKVNSSGMTRKEKNAKLNELYLAKKKEHNSEATPFAFMDFIYENFAPNGGKQYGTDEEMIKEGDFKVIQFHPAYSYEDFVRGIAIVPQGNSVRYETQNRILAQFAEQALNNPAGNYVLILDEINRANLPAVLGELIYALEYRYNPSDEKNTTVQGIYDYKGDEESVASNDLRLPDNLYIIGTMNTADRSVGHIDYAIRRRFAFVDVLPTQEVIAEAEGKALFALVENLFTEEAEGGELKYLSSDFEAHQVQLGHSYFMAEGEVLRQKLEYEIKPILREYVRDGILNAEAIKVIKDLGGNDVASK